MAAYEYDEAGAMAAYFLITFLALVLVPLTLSAVFSKSEKRLPDGCQCSDCIRHRETVLKQEKGSMFIPQISGKVYLIVAGWALFGFVSYRASQIKVENKVYNPFEILGIKSNTPDKEIKSHFKQLSRLYHPDKVKATANLTIEAIQNRFVDITKAYKSLTNEKIKENWQKYNNPDGPQSTTTGIALPKWIIEGKNNIWVLGAYGIMFGGALPALVGRWWFGNRKKTKDGIQAESAAVFFKTVKEESGIEEVVGALGKAYKWEMPASKQKVKKDLDDLEAQVKEKLGAKWLEVKKLLQDWNGETHASRRKALVLLYAHLLRLDVEDATLKKEQKQVLLQTPLLLNALLNVSIARTWLLPTLSIMRLYQYITQALPPNSSDRQKLTQLPGIDTKDLEAVSPKANISDLVYNLAEKKDPRLDNVKTAIKTWGRVDIAEASFKVIGESVITPSAIIYLLVKLRLSPPGSKQTPSSEIVKKELSVDETKKLVQQNHEIDEKFLESKKEAEELSSGKANGSAHAPHWPGIRKPSWWIVLADDKSNRVVVPPTKITDIPLSNPNANETDRDYRAYKVQFQGPPNTGLFTWRVYIVSDTFVGEDASADISLKIEDPPSVSDPPTEDEISEPDEDTIAGQMAAMKGQPVRKKGDESDDESGTDDDEESGDSDSSSDSD
ncbi:Sec63 Brl domain-containing protein [Crepidotus variabilis]|uniref:Sec63 Brl domain-containing protein n=1 Tax=Crepidotus variabilis TaxID=179855 RepID=A0A9P6ELV6_9AGAR|nr:Sec63 Brl domain-containing protein [Crepidotus variabilis]